jgi:integrase
MVPQRQTFELTRRGPDGERLWAYRYRTGGRGRQVLHRAVAWGMIDVNSAKVVGGDNPVRRRKEQHPFESWTELEALAAVSGPRYGQVILFAAATGLRPAEWIALEKRDVDRKEQVVLVRRSFTRGQLKIPKYGCEHKGGAAASPRPRCTRSCEDQPVAAAISRRARWLSRYMGRQPDHD